MMKPKFLIALSIAAALFLGLLCSQSLADNAMTLKTALKQTPKPDPVAEKWGIEVASLRMSANNHMIDFRYRVLDVEKADKLFAKEAKPFLVDQKTGKVLSVPRTAKVGPLMSTYEHKQGRIYWMFFGNSSGLVKAGDKVKVVIGEFKAENLVVE